MRKYLSTFVLSLCFCWILAGIPATALEFEPVYPDWQLTPLTADISGEFQDTAFKKAVWEWLGNSGSPGKFSIQDIRDHMSANNYELKVNHLNIGNLSGIEYFEGIKKLGCSKNRIKELGKIPSTITSLDCSFNNLNALPDALPADLESLNCSYNDAIKKIPPLPATIKQLYCISNNLTALPALPSSMIDLDCSENSLTELPQLPNLKKLSFSSNNISKLERIPSSVTILLCSDNRLTELPGLPAQLSQLNCEKNLLTELPALPNNMDLHIGYNYFDREQVAKYQQLGYVNTKPQYALNYSGSEVKLDQKGSAQIKTGDIKIRMTSDFSVWGDVEAVDSSKLTLTSSNNRVAKVDSTGLITGVGSGSCAVTGKLYGINAPTTTISIPVTVSDQIAEAVKPNDPEVEEEPASGQGNSDIDYMSASSWAVEELEAAEQYGLFSEKVKRNLKSDITREEFCSIVVKLYEALTGDHAMSIVQNPFRDSSDQDVIKAYGLGIVNGISADTFAPDRNITRQEICVMIFRALKAADPGLAATAVNVPAISFSDEDKIADWAIQAVRFANHNNIMKGVGDNRIDPLNNTSREQGIILIKRTYESFH